jgi:hypothetical protein
MKQAQVMMKSDVQDNDDNLPENPGYHAQIETGSETKMKCNALYASDHLRRNDVAVCVRKTHRRCAIRVSSERRSIKRHV